MMASPAELSLDCKPHSYSLLLKSVGEQQQTHDQTQKLEEFLSRLEEERLKIDAFKRELPLCMQLLTNAMEAYRLQLQSYRANQGSKPVLEEFIPIKHAPSSEGSDKDKANWMTSAQLWSQAGASEVITKQQQSPVTSPQDNHIENGFSVNHQHHAKQSLDNNNKQRNMNGGAFHPFGSTKERVSCQNQALITLPDLALASSDKDMEDQKNVGNNGTSGGGVKGGSDQSDSQTNNINPNNNNNNNNNNTSATSQTHRKARRCWSPDLHRRFVNALQMLGGSQVATPKQIRELMKVDGLTNDEVKSHLQKYRLHTRRPSPSPQAATAAAPQLVVLGGIWVPPEYATAAHPGAPAATLYGAHHPTAHASTHYCTAAANTGGPHQEFYSAPATAQAHQLHHHHHHHHPAAALHNQLHIYNQPPQAQSSPDSDVRGTGDRSESIEDGKSESSSWKADSNGENGGGGERKLLVVREEGEESNASEITLKF
ncbi:OLC1v1037195C1 [Oldenlandia corymbosa var. corymbosa]|uniref:OLC1v1037195C1 n=1 Tax=Oldenlandia corymbosa var. corymbosa TaxID=529605 RepID=A0AAV1D0S1_OLDCO|nr:OLC1v1037195C1 [Oldenlandia corymbosa var. corymbosa]